jgi:hypothetical protein
VLGGTKFVKKLISGEERAKTLFPSTETFPTHTHFEVRDYIIYPSIRTWPNKMISLLFVSPLRPINHYFFAISDVRARSFLPSPSPRVSEWSGSTIREASQADRFKVGERERAREHSALFEYTCPAVMFNCQKLAMIDSLLSVHCVAPNEAAF